MKVLLAGRVAEQITFGKVTTGATDDLNRVTVIARSMVYEYGMGTTIRSHQLPADDYNISETMRQTRDEEVSAISEEAYRGAQALITDHQDLLDEIAERLLANEVIEREEIKAIMAEQRDPGERETEVYAPAIGDPAGALASKPPPGTTGPRFRR
jgi:cell division protease FtsH